MKSCWSYVTYFQRLADILSSDTSQCWNQAVWGCWEGQDVPNSTLLAASPATQISMWQQATLSTIRQETVHCPWSDSCPAPAWCAPIRTRQTREPAAQEGVVAVSCCVPSVAVPVNMWQHSYPVPGQQSTYSCGIYWSLKPIYIFEEDLFKS